MTYAAAAAQDETIAFDLNCNGRQDIYTIQADGSRMRRLTASDLGSLAASPAWSPDGTKIAFHVVWIDGNRHRSELYLMNSDGTGQRQITQTFSGKSSWRASWSPDGSRIAFASDRAGNHDLYVMNSDGTGVQRLTETRGKGKHSWNPAWSPDGRRVAFDSNRSGRDEIYLVEVVTLKVTRLTRTLGKGGGSWTPDWSPDGRTIVFTSNRRGKDEHYVMAADGSDLRPLNLEGIGRPRWAPDGRKLVYQVKAGHGEENIVVWPPQGSPMTLVQKAGCMARHPDWCCRRLRKLRASIEAPGYAQSADSQILFDTTDGGAQEAARSKSGMDQQRLARIAVRMKEFVDSGTVAGVVTLVARDGEIVSLEAVGYEDSETESPMRVDTIFQIRSMTKPVTAVGIMILLEEGRLLLSDPVEQYVPEFRDQLVVEEREGEKVLRTKKPSRPITIRDLLTHTSGLPYSPDKPSKTLAEYVAFLPQVPLEFQPGTKFLYSDAGFDTLGRIIEVVSGQPYETYIERRILRPLGMKDTFFFPSPQNCSRIASHYEPRNGKLQRYEGYLNPDWGNPDGCRSYAASVRYPGPSWGLFSTASDTAAFFEMMLNEGSYTGGRIISRASVEAMTALQAGDLLSERWWGYGLGWGIQRERRGDNFSLEPAGAYGHSGLRGTFGWVDPQNRLIGIFMIQLESEKDQDLVRDTFIAMTYAAMED